MSDHYTSEHQTTISPRIKVLEDWKYVKDELKERGSSLGALINCLMPIVAKSLRKTSKLTIKLEDEIDIR